MENFELIDQYLTGKLEGQDKEAFENKLTSDPDFKSEVDLQAQILEGIKQARATELKAMLNKVPVGSAPFTESFVFRIAASVLGGGALIAALYFFNSNTNGSMGPIMSTSIEDSVPGKSFIDSSAQKEVNEITTEENPQTNPNPTPAPEKKKGTTKNTVKESGKPTIEVVDPSGDVTSQEIEKIEVNSGTPAIRTAQIEIETIQSDKKHSFHYQFEQQKLVLFGTFDKGLYEVIEINSDTRSLFLYYKSHYHLLDPSQGKITPLEPVTDSNLIRKLNQFRAQ